MIALAATVVAGTVVVIVIQILHLAFVVTWADGRTDGTNYFGQPAAERRRFKRVMFWHRLMLTPAILLLAKLSRTTFRKLTVCDNGLAAPKGTCTPETLRRAMEYEPRANDVFVVTQMKCGTTWMQHLVYQVLTRGAGDLVADDRTLYSVSPWLEARKSVSIDDAPVVGEERPCRLIKTHLPARFCPYKPDPKYIYVARDPLSCFASCIDFVRTNLGGFAPRIEEFERWFQDEQWMWWGTWPAHVRGWWRRSQEASNVLFVRFEDMKNDLESVARQVCDFLQVPPLGEPELKSVTEKCSFEYMRANFEVFEMTPPHLLQDGTRLFVSGRQHRYRDLPADLRKRMADWCRIALQETAFPLAELYPELAGENGCSPGAAAPMSRLNQGMLEASAGTASPGC